MQTAISEWPEALPAKLTRVPHLPCQAFVFIPDSRVETP